MKKTTLLFFSAALLFAACKKDSVDPGSGGPGVPPPPGDENSTLPSKIVVAEGDNSSTYVISYLADTKKLDKIVRDDGAAETFEYEGDLITKISYGGENYTLYEYDDNKLKTATEIREGNKTAKVEYTYPDDKKVNLMNYNWEDDEWEPDMGIELELDENGNLAKGNAGDISADLLYDSKNSPFINVTGWSATNYLGGVPMGENISFQDIVGRTNNPVKATVIMDPDADPVDIIYTYEFNDDSNPKFPTKINGDILGRSISANITY